MDASQPTREMGAFATAIIPARIASTRLPGKPLLRDTGKYLIEHVVGQAQQARRIARCIVATDDVRIADAVRSFGGEAVMTRADHPSGTDRIAEVVRGCDGPPDEIILNVQGDEPEIEPAALDALVDAIAAEPAAACPMATLAAPFPDELDPHDPNAVKVVRNARGHALYFSRALIPYPRDGYGATQSAAWLLHLGVYAYRRAFLLALADLPVGRLEQIERLEQLRVLENGHAIAVAVVPRAARGIDTPEDYERFVRRHAQRRGAESL